MQPVRATILTSIMAPHRIALFNALSDDPRIDLSVVYLAESDPTRQWDTHRDEMAFRYHVLRERRRMRRGDGYVHITTGLTRALRSATPQVLVVGGWDQPAYLLAFLARSRLRARFLWWVESNLRDRRDERSAARRVKERLVAAVDGIVVPGIASREYGLRLGGAPSTIHLAPNAVDNAFYAADPADREDRTASPTRFLFAGRLDSAKGVLPLMDAWAGAAIDGELAIVGDGGLAVPVADRIARTGLSSVRMTGHLEREALAMEYARADVFVFPSVSDPWGLVLNEAMAAGLPVIASSAPGAVDDLVRDRVNGFVIPPGDPGPMALAMTDLAGDPTLRRSMGRASLARIAAHRPQDWADGMAEAMLAVAFDGGVGR